MTYDPSGGPAFGGWSGPNQPGAQPGYQGYPPGYQGYQGGYQGSQPGYHGYPPPSAYLQPPRPSTSPAMWARLGTLLTWVGGLLIFAPLALFCWVTPLVVRSKYPNDPFVRHHATQALNSTLTGLVILPAMVILLFAAVLGPAGVAVAVIDVLAYVGLGITRGVYEIIGAVKASNGESFPIPAWLAFRFAKD